MGKISELINGMVSKILESAEWTSANPTHINRLIQINAVDNPDFESEIEKLISNGTGSISSKKTMDKEKAVENEKNIDKLQTDLEILNKGNIGKIKNWSSEQFGNVSGIASNPIGFIFGKIGTKLVRGGAILGLILLIEQIILFSINEMMKPGRPLDRRLKILADEQIIKFTRRSELAELRQGFRTVFVTSSPFIRGQQGIVGSNLFMHNGGITKDFQQPIVKKDISSKTSNTGMAPGQSRR